VTTNIKLDITSETDQVLLQKEGVYFKTHRICLKSDLFQVKEDNWFRCEEPVKVESIVLDIHI